MRRLFIAGLVIVTITASAQTPTEPTSPNPDPITQTADPADVETLKRQIQTLSDSTNEERKRAADAQRDAGRARARLKELQDELERTRATVPGAITLADRFVTDRSASFIFRTDRAGRLIAELQEVGGPLFEKRSDDLGTTHPFSFDNLAPNRTYHMKATVLDWTGTKTNTTLTGLDLNFSTAMADSGPVLAFESTPVERTANTITFAFTLTEPAFVRFECRERIPGTTSTKPCRKTYVGEAEVSQVGRPLGTARQIGRNVVTVDGLDPDQEYEFVPAGHDVLGLKLTEAQAERRLFKTSQRLDFKGPVRVQIEPAGIKVQWSPTTPPTKGTVRIKFGTKTLVDVDAPYDAASNTAEATVALTALAALLDRQPSNAATLPVIEILMNGNGTELSREFVVGFAVPKPDTPGLTKEQKEAAKAVTDSITQPSRKKIKWQELVQLGLPIVLSFL